MLNICSSVEDHNQTTINKDSDWTSQRAKKFYLKPTASGRMRLKKCVWRSAFEETSLKIELLKTRHQKQGHQKKWSSEASHQKPLHQSWQSKVYEVYNHELWAPPSLQSLSLQQDKDNSNIVADDVPSVLEWIWIKFSIGQLSNQAKDQGWRIKASKQDTLM